MNRDIVLNDYADAEFRNREAYENGDVRAGKEYIYENQKHDAEKITDMFYKNPIQAISVIKRTKVGMDGLMIELCKNMTTHPDDNFVLNPQNVFIITGMSNILWETEMKEKSPLCFRENILHHGKLHRLYPLLQGIKNALIIIDEVDNGNKFGQRLHTLLIKTGIWDMEYMEKNKIRFVFVSATMYRELNDLQNWGDKHVVYRMTVPSTYISHQDFLQMGILQEYYRIDTEESAKKWIMEDILDMYGDEPRVHIIRSDERYKHHIVDACKFFGISYRVHSSKERVSYEDLKTIFENVKKHTVLIIKGFYRRANLIPNDWKMRIGAIHERCGNSYDTNVQIQGLPGRMTGYWKQQIIEGHKTGPYRTSIKAMKQYEEFYKNPLSKIKYKTIKYTSMFVIE